MKLALTNFSLKHPWLVLVGIGVITVVFGLQFPKVHFDNDPENMLSPDEHVRIFHHQVKEKYKLYDFVIVGVVNEKHADGVFNVETLGRIHELTEELLSLRRGEDGKPVVVRPAGDDRPEQAIHLDLAPRGLWKRMLGFVFQHDANRLFDEDGNSAIIAREIISPSVVDNIKQADLGSLKIEYLMEKPPSTREEALVIRHDAMNNPLYKGTLVSEDGKAVCIYLPLIAKPFSYNVASLVKALTKGWDGDDQVYITGLPVAEDTFGVEMLVQMATSAPLAGIAIFLLLLLFFRRLSLIIAPMVLAVISIVWTMGLLIGLGYDVHIMSSMIAIFLMPIAVADSVHILSEFFDVYHRFKDKGKTIRHVIGHLFRPMLYTSLTTAAGFASLATTPIPPVQVFGLHVAFGVASAWVLTMTLIPAYILLFVPKASLDKLSAAAATRTAAGEDVHTGPMTGALTWLGSFSYLHWRLILGTTVLIMGVSVYGISKISVNDNPVKWFTASHPIRVADRVLNDHFGGTYTAYLTFTAPSVEAHGCEEKAQIIEREVRRRFGDRLPQATHDFLGEFAKLKQLLCNVNTCDPKACLVRLVKIAERIDHEAGMSWNNLADAVNYLDTEDLTFVSLSTSLAEAEGVEALDRAVLLQRLSAARALTGEELLERALSVCDEYTDLSFRDFVFEMEAELTAPLFKQPPMLRYLEGLQTYLHEELEVVGKTSSAVDALKKATFELNYVAAPADATPAEKAEFEKLNRAHFSVPVSAAAVGQVFTQLEGMKKKDTLFHLITKDYQETNIWVQLTRGENKDMETVVKAVTQYMLATPPPSPLRAEWAGLTYLNVVWQDRMVVGMIKSLAGSFVVVFVMMLVLFRSPLFGILAMIPLSVTITFIYGLIGWVGKDYDMPVAILSSLTLGLSVDFAIHFLERAREMRKRLGTWQAAAAQMFQEPAMAISRNAITISIGFTPLLLAPLVPYKTVGSFLATIMAVSWLATLFILPALITLLGRRLFVER